MAENPLVGTWRLVSFAVRDSEGAVTYPFGREVEGFITYTGDGRMAVHFGSANRTRLADPDWVAGGEALLIAAGQNLKHLLSRWGWGRRPFPSGSAGVVLPPFSPLPGLTS